MRSVHHVAIMQEKARIAVVRIFVNVVDAVGVKCAGAPNYAVNFVPKIKLEIVVPATMADQIVETITKTAKTGKIGDGKIFVSDIGEAVRIRTGETGDGAL